jgi:AcrR family transcriptional regulator
MARSKTSSPRNQPVQRRSKETVDALLTATVRVLMDEGYDACTTNRVAALAGVSIGSLYQYFPNKDALLIAVMERHQTQLRERLIARLATLGEADLPTAVHAMIHGMLEAELLQPKLHRVILEEVPRVALRRMREVHGEYEPLIVAWLEANRARLGLDSPAIAAYVLIGAVEGVLNRAILERPTWLETGLLADHLTRLVVSYLHGEQQLGRARA